MIYNASLLKCDHDVSVNIVPNWCLYCDVPGNFTHTSVRVLNTLHEWAMLVGRAWRCMLLHCHVAVQNVAVQTCIPIWQKRRWRWQYCTRNNTDKFQREQRHWWYTRSCDTSTCQNLDTMTSSRKCLSKTQKQVFSYCTSQTSIQVVAHCNVILQARLSV